jgi:hypothetical protein
MPERGFACPPPPVGRIPKGAQIHSGFGVVALCRDGVQIAEDYHGEHNIDWYSRMVDRRTLAGEAPVWTLHIDGPLSSQVYAFTADREWTLIERGKGFA